MLSIKSSLNLFCALSLFWVVCAFASDGVLEINQACVDVGCFAGDEAGFPVFIASPGSYILTSNLDVRGTTTPQDSTAIEISAQAEGSTIDLNGFSIFGPNKCEGFPVKSCEKTGTGVGVLGLLNKVTVRNGHIQGMGQDGVLLNRLSTVEEMIIEHCGSNGIWVGNDSIVKNNRISSNLVSAVRMGSGLAIGNVVVGNGGFGIQGVLGTGMVQNNFRTNALGHWIFGFQIGGNVCDVAVCP